MGTKSNIAWTDATWNIGVGCTKVDKDCMFCYMYRDSLKGTRYEPTTVRRTKQAFTLPLKLKEPSKIFTCSLTDFFIEELDEHREEAWEIIRRCPQHTFQILTKRPERILNRLPKDWGEGYSNVWIGTSVGADTEQGRDRIHNLIAVPAKVRFLSLEPLYGPVDIRLYINLTSEARTGKPGTAVDWVVIGGESGNENGKYRYRECKLEWIESIVQQCKEHKVPVFVKQLGTHLAKEMKLKSRHGSEINEFPSQLQIREFPA